MTLLMVEPGTLVVRHWFSVAMKLALLELVQDVSEKLANDRRAAIGGEVVVIVVVVLVVVVVVVVVVLC